MLAHVVAGRHAVVLTEDGGEAGGVGKAAGIHHFGDVHASLRKQLGSLLQTDAADEVVGRLTRELLLYDLPQVLRHVAPRLYA